MKHVVHVADYGNPAPGSFIPGIFALAKRLQDGAGRCSLIVRPVRDAVWHDAARERLDSFATASGAAQLYNLLWSAAPDVVHVHFVGWSVPATLAGYLRGVRVVWHLHSAMRVPLAGPARLARVAKYAWFGGGVYRFVTVSDELRAAVGALGVAPARTATIRNAVDTTRFRPPSDAERQRARTELGIRPGDYVLLFFGRDAWIKGADILLGALPAGCRLLSVGASDETNAAFERRVSTIALPFVADTAPLYWAADALVMPSRREGGPYTLLEGLCSGLPAVAGEIPPLAEIARLEPSLRLVKNDAASLADVLHRIPRPPAPAVEATRARFGMERWVDEVSRLYAA